MNKNKFNLRYFTDPQYRFPTIPQISIELDGFVLNGIEINISNIISVFYKNKYSQINTAFPFVGHSYYSILTKDTRLFFYGEHEDLSKLFDEKLERDTHLENNIFGLVRRWKQIGEEYQPTSFFDSLSKLFIEKYLFSDINNKIIWIVLIFAVLIFIVGILVFLVNI
jgi:hypothetical protein